MISKYPWANTPTFSFYHLMKHLLYSGIELNIYFKDYENIVYWILLIVFCNLVGSQRLSNFLMVTSPVGRARIGPYVFLSERTVFFVFLQKSKYWPKCTILFLWLNWICKVTCTLKKIIITPKILILKGIFKYFPNKYKRPTKCGRAVILKHIIWLSNHLRF